MTFRLISAVLIGAFLTTSSGFAQYKPSPGKPVPEGYKKGMKTGIVDMSTGIGSFKIVSPGDIKAFGKIDIEFTGTVLIIGLNGSATPAGNLRKEYDSPKRERTAYFGTGRLSIEGEWTAIQFFGKNMRAHWEGLGICRLYGEFDEKLETGTFKIAGDMPRPWMQGGNMFVLPRGEDARVEPKVKKADG